MNSKNCFKITVVRHSIRNRGGDRIVLDYLSFLITKGYRIDYFTNEVDTNISIDPSIQIKKIPYKGILGTIFFTFKNQFQSDVVLVDLVVMAFFAGFRNRKRILYLAQDYDLAYHKSIFLNFFIYICFWWVCKVFKIPIVSESKGLTDELSKFGPDNIVTIPNGIDQNVFYRNDQTEYQKRKSKQFVIFLFARKDYRKGLDIGIKTLESLLRTRQIRDWELWVIGEEKINIEGIKVVHLGFIKTDIEIRDIFSVGDVYLSPSRHEGFGLTQLEAMACGCVMVTTKAFTLVKHEVNGLVSPVKDWRSLAANLDRIMNDKMLFENLRQAGYFLAKQYDLKESCEAFERALRSAKSI